MTVLVAILAGGLLAYRFPDSVLWLAPVLKPAFAATMLAVGTLVRPAQLRTFAQRPSRALSGLAVQYTAMPLGAWTVSLFFQDPVVRAGIILTGCMPGAMASNVMTVLFRGDLVLSVVMTTIATLAAPLVLGFWLPLLADRSMDVPVGAMAFNAAWMVAGPVAIGIAFRAWRDGVFRGGTDAPPRMAGNRDRGLPPAWDRIAGAIAAAAIVLIILVVVAANRERLAAIGPALAAAMLALNLGGYGMAFLAGRALGWPAAQRRTLVIEVGLQNAGLGSVLALGHLGEAGAVPSAFYTFLCVVTASMALPIAGRGAAGPNETGATANPAAATDHPRRS